ncbi:MAG: ABC transporter permease, partial [Actinobacteria bacterium]|nr:ABC transporter permease [Actinomycetota bacterium]
MSGLRAILRRINLRHLLGRRLRTSLTLGGVAAGVALVFTVAIINATLSTSFRTTLRTLAGSADLEVSAADDGGLREQKSSTIAAVPGVARVVPAVRNVSQLGGPGGDRRTLILGITPSFNDLFTGERALRITGDFGPDGNGVILTDLLASELGISRGDSVTVPLPGRIGSLPVTGIVSGSEIRRILGGNLGLMRLAAAQRTFEKHDRIDYAWVTLDRDASTEVVRLGIENVLGGAAIVGDPGERARGFERTIGAIATLTSLAGSVSLFVAMFVIYNAMSMTLAERRRELSMCLA